MFLLEDHQAETKNSSLLSLFGSIQDFKDWMRPIHNPHWIWQFALLNLLIQMLISSRKAITDTQNGV